MERGVIPVGKKNADSNGQILPSNKLAAVANAISLPQESLREVLAMMDADSNGYVDLGELAPFHASGRHELDAKLLDAVDVNDFNRDAHILVANLSNAHINRDPRCATMRSWWTSRILPT
jgi:hypothetical protein